MDDMQDKMPLISVIMPVYNSEQFLRDSLDSICKQNYYDLEVVIVDDCSTDNSYRIVLDYQDTKLKIRYFRLKRNSGVAIARNTAISMARGQYLAFLDSDDIWEKGKIDAQMQLFKQHKSTPFTYTAFSYINEKGDRIKEKRSVPTKVTYHYLLRNTVITTSTVIINREIVGLIKFPVRKSAEDYSLWLDLLKQYGEAYGVNEAFTKYRKTATSISAKKFKEIKYFYAVQTEDMQIGKLAAAYNTICYIIKAIKKHYF